MAARAAGELSDSEFKGLEAHLAECARCREAFSVYQSGFEALRSLRRRGSAEMPEDAMRDFWPEVRRRIRQAQPTFAERLHGYVEGLRAGWVPRLVGAAAAAAAVALLVWVLSLETPAPQRDAVVSAPSAAKPPSGLPVAATAASKPQTGEVPFTPVGKIVRGVPRFFALRPVEPGRPLDPGAGISALNAASLSPQGTTYALPSTKLVSADER